MPTIVKSNQHWRPFVYRSEVPAKVLADRFGHLPDEYDGFLCYRGWWYHLSDFLSAGGYGRTRPTTGMLAHWDGYHGDSFFSGVVINVSEDGAEYQIGTYVSTSAHTTIEEARAMAGPRDLVYL